MDDMKGRVEAKSSRTSEHVASMFSGWRGVHRASSAIAGSSAVLGEDGLSVRTYTENFFSSHLDEAGEPWGATRGPQGRCGQPPDGSDGHGVAHPNLRGREGVNTTYSLLLLLRSAECGTHTAVVVIHF